MSAPPPIRIQEYLRAVYRPDRDYVDGTLLERNVGRHDHSRLLGEVAFFYVSRRTAWKLRALFSLRIRVSPTRIRVPDLVLLAGDSPEQILTSPPLACIEVLSPDDRLSEMQERVNDYLYFGVPYVWIVDPGTRKAWRCTETGMLQVNELRTEDPDTVVPIAELFED